MTSFSSPPNAPEAHQYRYDIDGLRAIAVATVVIYHLSPTWLPNGYLGVDIFFVISGYLITNIIWREMAQRSFSILRFYERRIRRILPALLCLLLVVSAASALILLPADLIGFGKSVIATLLFSANIYFWRDTNYFAAVAEQKPLLNLWSLGVEEQFYIFFPILLFVLVRLSNRRAVQIVWGCVLVSFGLDVLLRMSGGVAPAFYLLPTRAWEMGVGAAFAMQNRDHITATTARSPVWAAIGMALIVVGFFIPLSPSGAVSPALLSVAGAGLIVAMGAPPQTVLGRALGWKPVRFLGLISYSVYLWHWPIIVLAQYWLIRHLTPLEALGAGLASVLLGTLSWRYVERPFRQRTMSVKKVVTIAAAGYAAAAMVAGFLWTSGGLPARLPAEAAQINAAVGTHFRCEVSQMRPFGASRACDLNMPSRDPDTAKVVLLGNSHAQMYAPLIKSALQDSQVSGLMVPINGCLPTANLNISDKCAAAAGINEAAISAIENLQVVIIAQSWPLDRLPDSAGRSVQDRANAQAQATLQLAERFATQGITPVIVGPILSPEEDISSQLSRQIAFGHPQTIARSTARTGWDAQFASAVALLEASDYTVIRPDLVQCPAENCAFVQPDGTALFSDNNHIAATALNVFAPAFETQLRPLLAPLSEVTQ